MDLLQRVLHCDGRTGRLTYQRNVALLAVGKAAVDLLTLLWTPGLDVRAVVLSWVDPFILVPPAMEGTLPLITCVATFAFFTGLVWNSVHRLHDTGWNHWLALLAAVPFVDLVATVVFALVPSRKRTVWDLI